MALCALADEMASEHMMRRLPSPQSAAARLPVFS